MLSAPLELLTDSFSDEEEEPDVLPEEAPEEVLEEPDEEELLPEEVMTVRIAVGGDEERTIEID